MTTARDIMHQGAECVGEQETLVNVAKRMTRHGIGSMLVCDADQRIRGIITDRDIVVKCLAYGHDPQSMTAGELAQDSPVTVDPDADVRRVLQTMEDHLIRRLPVVENDRPVGVISEADLARHLSEDQVGHFVEVIAAAK
ncbi:CBS domain-containing protein [Streptomyces purpurogeneiscleroticus]|uniref:CBS domain-containing protein n=1 Tax=Streptomyces purpurogeneiscleroticus TaxID=68259 RepID=UPI001CBEC552|nr:CBS domain-containing protein [Streptomyces purpurogeneiscleroticus]MBZ4019638.1 CBS domain-containing protein [Streptomyces purpurogeneiscleroticus]